MGTDSSCLTHCVKFLEEHGVMKSRQATKRTTKGLGIHESDSKMSSFAPGRDITNENMRNKGRTQDLNYL